MAKNVTMEESIYQLLKDVDRNYFTSNRQLNKNSMLYQTIEEVQDKGWFNKLELQTVKNYPLATATLKTAELTEAGVKHLAELKDKLDTNKE
ncbi:hypothetical protein [Companilactobacillus mishanensis]|uniref:Uncharacterized protein n=1 Tax=Companilactobacillus mishanensis TaxID=2486008 RepID=A0A5P0ZKF8_9LACO|nr:hypothetical protein [Companilactobacillus mishanensis]MQS45906.1 hypothetical protein [Companilactobacillus mishanensis]MQS53606.1 hypothetical protein [Companilactobacillus mishanensis]